MKMPELIVIGCSLGGMRALQTIFSDLPADFPVPIAVAQHRHKASNEGLPAFLRKLSKLPVVDVDDKEWIRPGKIKTLTVLDRAVRHLEKRGEFSLSVDVAVAYSRPSIDVLFESAADAYGDHLVGIILTGANADGANGAEHIRARNGFLIVQDPADAEAPSMPEATIQRTRVDRILPLKRIAPFLVEICRVPAGARK